MNQNAQKLISFMMSLTKITKIHETKKNFSFQTQRLAKSVEGFNSSLPQPVEELCCWKENQTDFGLISKYNIFARQEQMC